MDIFEMMCSLKNGDGVDVFVKHLVDEPIVVDPPIFLENVSLGSMEESGASFDNRPNFMVGEDHINVEDPFTSFSTSPPCTTTPHFITADGATAYSVSTPTATPSVVISTVAPSVAAPSAAPPSAAATSVASPSVAADSTAAVDVIGLGMVPVGEVGPDLGFDDTETGKASHEGRLGGDEPYFASSDEGSFELDKDDCCGDEEHDVLASERIIEQPNIRVFNVQELIRKKFKLYVGKTIVRRARAKVLKDIMGDHAVEFERILDYNDELLRINPGTSCVVKLNEANEEGKPKFRSFYTCFDALKKAWCKLYFNTEVKCDFVDNNMSEYFNAWILLARHKTIINMLEEIRVKMMTRIGTLREFSSTWKSNYSPICLKVLEENINRSMDCTIQFTEVAGFEVKEELCHHKVDIVKRTCSCRVWQLKGILCAHRVAAILFKKYLFSSNIIVTPPEITTMPGRLPKIRKKKVGETKKSEKLPRIGLEMPYSKTPTEATNAAPQGKKDGSDRERGRLKKTPPEAPNAAPQGKSNDSGRGRGRSKPGMPSSKIYCIGQAKVARSADMTGGIGYTPSSTSKLKWNDKSTISTKKLQELKENRRKWKVVQTIQVIPLLHSPRCHENCSDVDVF
ncbi:putative C2 and GRAM domain-containing protein-like [Capsicum annuum]|nr:putative C2 and GRAM domain-containing protein-like [Capsicum annuum]